LRVIYALILRETRTRLADSKLGYGWALIEPVLHIVVLSLVFAVMMRGRPPIGDKFFIFYYTGIIPYHLFVRGRPALYRLGLGCRGFPGFLTLGITSCPT
jgi:capsular polysaccharide transport system permease protein